MHCTNENEVRVFAHQVNVSAKLVEYQLQHLGLLGPRRRDSQSKEHALQIAATQYHDFD